MPRIAHIKNGFIINVSMAADSWTAPLDGSQMLESEALATNIPWQQQTLDVAELVPTMRSFRLACQKPLWQSIEAVVGGIPDENEKWKAQQFLEYSTHVARNHPLVGQLAAALNLTDSEVDAVFTAAQALDNNIAGQA
jgi:hypothetical protein